MTEGKRSYNVMNALHSFIHVVRRDPFLVICALFLLAVILCAFVGIYFTGYTYDQISAASLLKPSRHHLFGTDLNGHDLLTRALYGARISLIVAALGTTVSLLIGIPYGMISGYTGGRVDNLMMRAIEIAYSLPTLILVIVFVTTLEAPAGALLHAIGLPGVPPRMVLIVAFLGLTEWFTMARIVRGQVLVLREQAFIQASSALGQTHAQILRLHIFPNLMGIIIVYLTLTVPAIMLDESFMSFLGVGVPAPLASWGTLVADAATLINPVKSYWWMLIFPAGFMTFTLLALNFLGDGLRDALDPRTGK
jgi:oligopeptide transport system permease protein